MANLLKNCQLCPHNCGVNRYLQKGRCNATSLVQVSLATLYFYEEPPISGTNGSGTIFFTNCNLKCCYCQNKEISHQSHGLKISITRLSEIMLELQNKQAHNINLVTPTMYVPQIIKAIKKARRNGLTIPIVYNSSGYEKKETIQLLDGLIDIYLPDFKYYNDIYSQKYSQVKDYFYYFKESLQEMVRQTGPCQFDQNGLLKKGVIVRHLILPTLYEDSKKILQYLYETYQDNIYISIMNQYTPIGDVKYKELQKPIKKQEYYLLIDYALQLGIKNAFCQEDETVSESFIPHFNFMGVKKENK